MLDVWKFAHRFQVLHLEKSAVQFIGRRLNVDNVDKVLNVTRVLDRSEYWYTLRWIGNHLHGVVESKNAVEWLDKLSLAELKNVLSFLLYDEEHGVSDEEEYDSQGKMDSGSDSDENKDCFAIEAAADCSEAFVARTSMHGERSQETAITEGSCNEGGDRQENYSREVLGVANVKSSVKCIKACGVGPQHSSHTDLGVSRTPPKVSFLEKLMAMTEEESREDEDVEWVLCEKIDGDEEYWLRNPWNSRVASAMDVFKAICCWAEFDLCHRNKAMDELFASWLNVDRGISPEDLSENSRRHSACQSRRLMSLLAIALIILHDENPDLRKRENNLGY